MVRVLVSEAAFNIGGSATSVELVLRRGLERGYDFELLSAIPMGKVIPEGVRRGRLHVLNHWPVPARVYYSVFLRQAFDVAKRLLLGRHQVMMLNNGLHGNAASLFAAKLMRRPAIQMQRGFEFDSRIWDTFHSWPDAFVAVSECVRDHLIERGVPRERVVLAPEGISARDAATDSERLALRRKLGIADDARIIGFVGRLDEWKGYHLFVDAAMQAIAADPLLHAVMVGGAVVNEQPKIDALMARISEAGMEDRIHMVGEVAADEVDAYVRGMDMMLHTTITEEPFGRVLLEAMAVGVPVISSSRGGPREIIVDGVSGVLVEPENVAELAEAVGAVYAAPGRLEALGRAARERARTTYSEEVCAGPVLALLKDLAEGRGIGRVITTQTN